MDILELFPPISCIMDNALNSLKLSVLLLPTKKIFDEKRKKRRKQKEEKATLKISLPTNFMFASKLYKIF